MLLGCLALALLWWPGAALAQDAADDVPTFVADFGFANRMPTERWAPLTVWVTGGEKPYSGLLTVEYRQDATQNAHITAPFATTPGKTTAVPFVVALPVFCQRVTINLCNDRGWPLRTLRYTMPAGPDEAALPPLLDPTDGLIVGVGRTSLPALPRRWSDPTTPVEATDAAEAPFPPPPAPSTTEAQDERGDAPISEAEHAAAWRRIHSATITPDRLPLAAMALDGVLALVVEADAALAADPRSVEAVREWVAMGGRLVIVATGPGTAWRSWLPEGRDGDLVRLDPPEDGPVPAEAAAAIAEVAAAHERARRERRMGLLPGEQAGAGADEPGPVEIPPPAERVSRRMITLGERARDLGWVVRWSDPAGGERGALAEGPVGFGWVMILGLDPARTPAVVSNEAASVVWQAALGNAIGDWLDAAVIDERLASQSVWPGVGWPSGEPRSAQAAVAAINVLGGVPPPSPRLFVLIAAGIALLAILAGPVDYLLLGRLRARQRSWMTALAWIVLASAAAWAGPVWLRAGPTRVSRLTVVDRLVEPGEGAVGEPGPACTTGLTGIFANASGRLALRGVEPGGWWRGCAPGLYANPASELGARLRTTQAPGNPDHGNPLTAVGMNLWTFRTLMDWSVRPSPITGAIRRAAAGDGWLVTIAGLPDGAMVAGAVVRVGDGWYRAGTEGSVADGGAWSAAVSAGGRRAEPPPGWAWESQPPMRSYAVYGDYHPADQTLPPATILALAGPDQRSHAIERLVASGRWAVVYLELRGLPPAPEVDWEAEYEHRALVRVVLPLAPEDRPDPVSEPAPPEPEPSESGAPADGPSGPAPASEGEP